MLLPLVVNAGSDGMTIERGGAGGVSGRTAGLWSPNVLCTASLASSFQLQCAAVCCSVLQCAAVCCSVLSCGRMLQSTAVCCTRKSESASFEDLASCEGLESLPSLLPNLARIHCHQPCVCLDHPCSCACCPLPLPPRRRSFLLSLAVCSTVTLTPTARSSSRTCLLARRDSK